MTFPGFFALENLLGACCAAALPRAGGICAGLDGGPFAAAYVGLWLAAEAWLATAVGWQFSWRSPLTWLLRELLLPALWVHAWFGNSLSWRGSDMTVAREDWAARASRS